MRAALLIAHRVMFLGLLALAAYRALRPGPADIYGLDDKTWHFAAFYVLAMSAACAAPRLNPLVLAAALAGLGALVEVLQVTISDGRTASAVDWLYDVAGVMAALGPLMIFRWRDQLARDAYDQAAPAVQGRDQPPASARVSRSSSG